jgi:hypothetical protein
VIEWLENPVTLALKDYAQNEITVATESRGLDCYVAYEPQKTQENMATANAFYVAWGDIVEILDEGEALFLEEDDE